MRTVKVLLALFAAVVIFNSCKKEYAEPTIAWTPDDLSQYVDFADDATYNKTLNIEFAAEAGISEIVIWKHIYQGLDVTSVVLDPPTGYDALLTFDYTFTTTHVASDFAEGVTKIVYEFEVTDKSEVAQTKTKEYSFFIDEVYAATFTVKDEQGVAITDATVTFNGVEMTAAPYVFNFIPEGTYTYSVAKAGYSSVTVSDFVMAANDTTVNVELLMDLSAWSANTMISMQPTYAMYHNVAVTSNENATIGFKYTTNNGAGTAAVVTKTTGCDGWVEVANADYTTETQIAAAYAAGTVISTADLAFDYEAKAFAPRYFISKVGTEYYLVKYVAGVVSPSNHTSTTGNFGNVLVFQYKN